MWDPIIDLEIFVNLLLESNVDEQQSIEAALIREDPHSFDICYTAGGLETFCDSLISGRKLPKLVPPVPAGFYGESIEQLSSRSNDNIIIDLSSDVCNGVEFWIQHKNFPSVKYGRKCQKLSTSRQSPPPVTYRNEAECLNDLISNQLPYDSSGRLGIHHGEAYETGKWNSGERWLPFKSYQGKGNSLNVLSAPCTRLFGMLELIVRDMMVNLFKISINVIWMSLNQ